MGRVGQQRVEWRRRGAFPTRYLLAVLALGLVTYRVLQIQQFDSLVPADTEMVRVLRVIDGDTLLVDGNRRVRLLGVDTPETKHPDRPPEPFGNEATAFTQRFVEQRVVQLRFDVEKFDDYNRLLAFVFVEGQLLNEQLVLEGLASAEPQYPFSNQIKKKLIAAEEIAKQQRKGIWSLE